MVLVPRPRPRRVGIKTSSATQHHHPQHHSSTQPEAITFGVIHLPSCSTSVFLLPLHCWLPVTVVLPALGSLAPRPRPRRVGIKDLTRILITLNGPNHTDTPHHAYPSPSSSLVRCTRCLVFVCSCPRPSSPGPRRVGIKSSTTHTSTAHTSHRYDPHHLDPIPLPLSCVQCLCSPHE